MSQPATSHQPHVTSSDEVLVKVEGVSKKFCRDLKKSLWYGVCDIGSELLPFGRRSAVRRADVPGALLNEERGTKNQERGISDPFLRPGEFWANKDISFELRRGECLGLIGRNGAGKTTLLKMLNGLIKPDAGSIEMRGRVGALIALGAGFNPILTGRENIYVNGSVLGLTKREIDDKLEGIIDFAGIPEFIDTPVQSYSSGMQVRLGFAVATAMDPDVLILDEVLAVGDAAFRNKCYQRVLAIRKKASVIFVSHSMEQVGRICDKAIFLSKGLINRQGLVAQCIEAYESHNSEASMDTENFLHFSGQFSSAEISIECTVLSPSDALNIRLRLIINQNIEKASARILFYSTTGEIVGEANVEKTLNLSRTPESPHTLDMEISSLPFRNGNYPMSIVIFDQFGDTILWSYKQHVIEVSGAYRYASSNCVLEFSKINSIGEY